MHEFLVSLVLIALASATKAQDFPAPSTETAPSVETAPPPVAELTERCGVIISENGASRTEVIPDFSIANAALPLQLPEGYEQARAVACGRAELLFTDNDFRVVFALSKPFYLMVADRLIVLEMVGGQFTARPVRGQLTPEEGRVLQRALSRAQNLALQEAPNMTQGAAQ